MVDEVEQALVGPVQVLEHEHEWALLGDRFEEATPGGERLRPMVASERLLALQPDERADMALDPVGFRVLQEIAHAASQLGCGLAGGIRLEDARLRLHHLAETPERDALAVRQGTALPPIRQVRLALDYL